MKEKSSEHASDLASEKETRKQECPGRKKKTKQENEKRLTTLQSKQIEEAPQKSGEAAESQEQKHIPHSAYQNIASYVLKKEKQKRLNKQKMLAEKPYESVEREVNQGC